MGRCGRWCEHQCGAELGWGKSWSEIADGLALGMEFERGKDLELDTLFAAD